LENYYQTNFSLAQHHKYSITEIENWIVFERDLYVEMLVGYLKETEERQRQQAN
jgi:hypothetical protein